MEFSFRCPSPPNTYSYVREENLGSTQKVLQNRLWLTCIINLILAIQTHSAGWALRNLSETAEKSSSSPRTAYVFFLLYHFFTKKKWESRDTWQTWFFPGMRPAGRGDRYGMDVPRNDNRGNHSAKSNKIWMRGMRNERGKENGNNRATLRAVVLCVRLLHLWRELVL